MRNPWPLLVCGGLALICLLIYITKTEARTFDNYFKDNDFELTGIVVGRKVAGHDVGMLRVKITKSNRSNYDIRSSHKPYYAVIKSNEAELIQAGVHEIGLGDSVVVSSKKKEFSFYHEGVLQQKYPLRLELAHFGNNELSKLHEL